MRAPRQSKLKQVDDKFILHFLNIPHFIYKLVDESNFNAVRNDFTIRVKVIHDKLSFRKHHQMRLELEDMAFCSGEIDAFGLNATSTS